MSISPPPLSPPSRADTERLVSGLWRLNRLLGQGINGHLEARHGIDMRSYGFLKLIEPGTYPKHIAEKIKLPGSLVSRHLDQLVTLGLIERQVDAQDSRRIRLELTEQGRSVVKAAEDSLHDTLSQRLSHLDPTTLSLFLETLDTLANDLSESA